MKNKVIIAVAPTDGTGTAKNNPVRSKDIASDVIRCAQAGATVVHMHARDEAGRLTTDLTAFDKAVSTIKDSCDIILEASTGGHSNLSADERAIPTKNVYVEMGSLNIGSLNFGDNVYKNSLVDVRSWIKTMEKREVKPSLEIFDTGNMESALHLIEQGLISLPCNFSFIFDIKWGMPYHPSILHYLKRRVPRRCNWGALLVDSSTFANHIKAARAGAKVLRVGFEDSVRYDSRIAASNEELVVALRSELEAHGFSIATVKETREILLKKFK